MRSAVLVFPGSNCDRDLAVALERATGQRPEMVWHRETSLPAGLDLIGVPGGFSYGDYLRSGAMAARSPIMQAVVEEAGKGRPVLGICNGFQVLTEAGLLPGALMRNAALTFVCRDADLTVANNRTLFTSGYANKARRSGFRSRTTTATTRPMPRRWPASRAKGQVAFPLRLHRQRLGQRHRRDRQRARQRAWHDAAPGAGGRAGARQSGWPAAVRQPGRSANRSLARARRDVAAARHRRRHGAKIDSVGARLLDHDHSPLKGHRIGQDQDLGRVGRCRG
jgi:hypothetical protein